MRSCSRAAALPHHGARRQEDARRQSYSHRTFVAAAFRRKIAGLRRFKLVMPYDLGTPCNPGCTARLGVGRPGAAPIRQRRNPRESDCSPANRSGDFPGIIGYDETVVPQIVNAILSRHDFILLGLRGQAKSRILRALTDLLDPAIPVIPGCEIHDDPLAPLCAACRARVARRRRCPANRLAAARCAFRRKARDARRHDRRHDRRSRSDQGGACSTAAVRRADDALRPAASRAIAASSRSTSCPTWQARSRSASSTSFRKATYRSKDTRCGCGSMCCWSSAPTPRTTPPAARSSRRSKIASVPKSAPTIRRRGKMRWRSPRRKPGSTEASASRVEIPDFVRELVEEVAFQARRTEDRQAFGRQPAPARSR